MRLFWATVIRWSITKAEGQKLGIWEKEHREGTPSNGHTFQMKLRRSNTLILAKRWLLIVPEVAGSKNALRILDWKKLSVLLGTLSIAKDRSRIYGKLLAHIMQNHKISGRMASRMTGCWNWKTETLLLFVLHLLTPPLPRPPPPHSHLDFSLHVRLVV